MKTRRKFSREFKLEAVRLANDRNVTLKQVASERGINAGLLGKWRKQLEDDGEIQAFPGKGKPRDEELARVRKERDFLKEAGC